MATNISFATRFQEIAIRNLDYILTVASQAIANASPDIMAKLEKLLDLRSSEPWSYRRLPTPTATLPVIINSEEEDSETEILRSRDNHMMNSMKNEMEQRSDSFFHKDNQNEGISKQIRALRKKLQQIEMLESKQSCGYLLDEQQIAKLQTKAALESSLLELGIPVDTLQAKPSLVSSDEKGNKNTVLPKKHRRRSKCKLEPLETSAGITKSDVEPDRMEEFHDVEIPSVAKNKVRLEFFFVFLFGGLNFCCRVVFKNFAAWTDPHVFFVSNSRSCTASVFNYNFLIFV